MNREIKFRGFIKNTGKMVDLHSVTLFAINVSVRGDGLYLPFMDEVVLMQYTGLKDKNGIADIYEGDIIDIEGNIIGNIYESSQVQQKGITHTIASMGTEAWRESESIAMGRGCRYAK